MASKQLAAAAMTSTTASSSYARHIPLAEKACAFLTASPDPFHAVANSVSRLQQNGFTGLNKSSNEPLTGQLQPGGKYYYTVENSALVAFTVGTKYKPGNAFGFHMIGGHVDSPNLKIKPRSSLTKSGCKMLAVECYGGGLWHTWFDRDLSVSGRVLLRSSASTRIQQRLVKLSDPIARISTLCIHLQSAEERKGFSVNKETDTAPMVATTQEYSSNSNSSTKTMLEKGAQDQINTTDNSTNAWRDGQEPLLLQAIAQELGVQVEEIIDFELNLYDTQPAALGGLQKEFLYSARLDNLATVFCAVEGLVDYANSTNDNNDSEDVSLIVAFDHEEVGSQSATGAGSPIMEDAIRRISAALQKDGIISPDLYTACVRKSFILSIDQAHAIHPNYASKHEASHAPKINAGVVIKTNSNQRYATTHMTAFVVRELGRLAGVPIQEFVVRNDCPCGSTIGPTLSAKTGIRTVDAGMPQLSMHSCREVMGIADCKFGWLVERLVLLCRLLLLLLLLSIYVLAHTIYSFVYF
jgi:aspartyl aminopeptidase